MYAFQKGRDYKAKIDVQYHYTITKCNSVIKVQGGKISTARPTINGCS
jgi:hypothetical protein